MRVDGIITKAKSKRLKGKSDAVVDLLDRVHDTCFLIWEDAVAKDKVKRIGYWPQCFALGVLWSLVQKSTPYADHSSDRIAAAAIEHGWDNKWITADAPKHSLIVEKKGLPWHVGIDSKQEKLCLSYEETLTLFLRTRQDKASIPCFRMAEAVHRSFLSFVFLHLSNSDEFKPNSEISEEDLVEHLVKEDYESPMVCFQGMVSFLGIGKQVRDFDSGESGQRGHSWIEPSIWRYVTSIENDKRRIADAGIKQAVTNIDNTLRLPSDPEKNERRLVVLEGKTHSGKKAVIGDFLKLVHDRCHTPDLRYTVQKQDSGDYASLPVLCLQTKNRDAVTICIEVLVFLQRLAQSKPQPQDEVCQARWAILDQSGSAQRLSDLLSLIQEAHQAHPALFIFLDAQPVDTTDTRNLLKKMRIDNLITAMNDGHKDSRFLLTTQDEQKVIGTLEDTSIPLEQPTFKRLAWYLTDKEEKEFAAFAKDKVDGLKGRTVDGNALLVLSVLFSKKSLQEDAFLKLVENCVNQTGRRGSKPLDDLCRCLISIWEQEKLLPFIALILASDDGMMQSTLEELTQEWRDCNGSLQALSFADGLNEIKQLSQRGRGLFLRLLPPAAYIQEELRFTEEDLFDSFDQYQTWNFDSGIVATLRRLMSTEDRTSDIMREAHRLVAKAARSRARYQQLKGVTVRREYGPRLPERSIQAYVSLMLSMTTQAEYSIGKESFVGSVPLTLATSRVFALDGAGYHQPTALRYAYHVLIGEETDPGHKLSMTLDADFLKLQLFTMLCANPGSVKFWDDTWYMANQDRLPAELEEATLDHLEVFPKSDQADILASLGMAAFYCNHLPILMWAEARLFERRSDTAQLAEQLSRLISARVDMECQLGRPIGRRLRARNTTIIRDYDEVPQFHSLVDVHEKLRRDIDVICSNITQSGDLKGDIGSFDFAEVSAWLRLKTRVLLLEQLIDPTARAEIAFEELILLENDFLAEKKSSRSIAQHGRTGRIQLKSRTHNFPILCDCASDPRFEIPEELKIRTRRMVHANVSRLSQFSGSERALSLNDHARYLMLDNQKKPASRAASEARRVAFQGLSSDTTRLEVLMLETAVQLAQSEDEALSASRRTDSLSRVVANLALLDRLLSANDMEFEKVFLHVLAWRACQMGTKLKVDVQMWDASDQLYLAIDRARGYEALGLVPKLEALRGC